MKCNTLIGVNHRLTHRQARLAAALSALFACFLSLAGCGSGDYSASVAGNATVQTPLGTFTYGPFNVSTTRPTPVPSIQFPSPSPTP